MRVANLAAVAGASAVQFALLAASSLVLAKLLSVDDFAVTRVVTAYMVVLTLLGHFCLSDALTSFVGRSKNELDKSEYVVAATYMVVTISVIFALLGEAVIYLSGFWVSPLKEALAVTVVFLPVASLSIVYASVLQAVGSYRNVVTITVLGGMVPAIALCTAAAIWQLPGWVFGRGASFCILLFAGFWFMRPLIRKIDIRTFVPLDLFRFARVQILSGGSSMILQVIDIIIIERISTNLAEVAVYGLASQLAKSVLFFPGALGRVFFGDIAQAASEGKDVWPTVNSFLLTTVTVTGIIAAALYFLGPPLIEFAYGHQYMESVPVLKVMCLGIVPTGLWTVLSVTNIAIKRPAYSVAISVTGLMSAVVLLAIWVPSHGAIGAAWAMNVAYALGFIAGILMLVFVERQERRP